jgi:uncharacterized phage-associated protein
MSADIRAVANFILDLAERQGIGLSNMAVNKIAYFAYEDFLLAKEQKLTNAKIEAWLHGPVFRELYSSFKNFGEELITARATRPDAKTGHRVKCTLDLCTDDLAFLEASVSKYFCKSAAQLRNFSHLPGSPWDRTWNHSGTTNSGMHISDELILDCALKGWRQ